ncbi:response regulator [Hymenobacter glacialis]|uniref:Response regulatory domain-containing protein n=1 Tax=Hymenobacter glacialis TaxID=1908236 RepID=A0A1G1SW81_9BACT|nr:response regulator [Hymenobacter glacialis]OGX82880.1 hypothetical protein BEN48_17410 [Hymenobacter glacialis]
MKTYLIDDDALAIYLNEHLLRTEGFSTCICTFQSAQGALDTLLEKTKKVPKVVFLDLNMPMMDGWEFLDALTPHQEALRGSCRIYILTSSLAMQDLEKSKQYDLVAGLIHKPLDARELQELKARLVDEMVADDEPCDC